MDCTGTPHQLSNTKRITEDGYVAVTCPNRAGTAKYAACKSTHNAQDTLKHRLTTLQVVRDSDSGRGKQGGGGLTCSKFLSAARKTQVTWS